MLKIPPMPKDDRCYKQKMWEKMHIVEDQVTRTNGQVRRHESDLRVLRPGLVLLALYVIGLGSAGVAYATGGTIVTASGYMGGMVVFTMAVVGIFNKLFNRKDTDNAG